MHGWMEGWKDGRMDGWMDGWMCMGANKFACTYLYICVCTYTNTYLHVYLNKTTLSSQKQRSSGSACSTVTVISTASTPTDITSGHRRVVDRVFPFFPWLLLCTRLACKLWHQFNTATPKERKLFFRGLRTRQGTQKVCCFWACFLADSASRKVMIGARFQSAHRLVAI